MKRILIILAIFVILAGAGISSGTLGLKWDTIGRYLPQQSTSSITSPEKIKVVSEESVVTDVVDKVSPSVVTVSISSTRSIGSIFDVNPFDPLGGSSNYPGVKPKTEQDIGSGFIVSTDGLIVTNKHVVSDTTVKYKAITKDNKSFDVVKIYRDPSNDISILKINAAGLNPVTMGDSSALKVGQMAIAIGTALGEFRNTVTVGVISGLGRGITAGSPFEGSVERLDNVIQTDAAINPGNSGGPLLNSSGQVIGIDTAVSQEGQNIGFAIPINVVKDALAEFNKTGSFQRPFLGVQYKIITRDLAILNEVPEGAYVQDVVAGSPAEKAGIQGQDIITKIDGQKITDQNELSKIISGKKIGDKLTIEIWRDRKTLILSVTLGENSGD